jgi:hypothetical protein
VDFAETVAALEELARSGRQVEVVVAGTDGAVPFVTLAGPLSRMPEDPDLVNSLPAELADVLRTAEEAVTFVLGQGEPDYVLHLWPSRFVSATADDINGVIAITRDARLMVSLRER